MIPDFKDTAAFQILITAISVNESCPPFSEAALAIIKANFFQD